MGDLDKARLDFSRAIELDNRLAEAYYHRAQVYEALNQPEKAGADRRQAKRLGYFGDEATAPSSSAST
jgi:Tfp pilus assembly protein PilF